MAETLLTPSSIKLFGRVMQDLLFKYDLTETVSIGSNNFLQQQLSANLNSIVVTGVTALNNNVVTAVSTLSGLEPGMTVTGVNAAGGQVFPLGTTIRYLGGGAFPSFTVSANPLLAVAAPPATITVVPLTPQFARIYAFSFEGAFYNMPKPSIFLVHGPGTVIDMTSASQGYRTTLDQSGVIAREWEFSAQKNLDMVFWEYEKGDFSIRLDTEAGQFEQILLATSLRSGADRADRSGAGVSGAGVSGAGVSGAGVSGAGVSGAGVRR
jgi:hypothetical protein